MPTDVWTYSKLLAEQLRINGVREHEVREIVAQVQEHTASTRQDPVEAFGQPADYAASWHPLRASSWLLRLVGVCVGWAGLAAIITSLLPDEHAGWGDDVDITASPVSMVVGWTTATILAWTVGFWLSRQRARALGDPRRQRLVRATNVTLFLLAAGSVVALFWWADDSFLPSGTLFSLPRWLVLAVGLLTLPGLFLWGSPNRAMPAPPRSSWTTRVRRSFGQS